MLSYTHCILRLTLSGILNRELILQPFRRFTYSFSNLSVTSPTSQFILQPFRCFTYVTAHSQPFRCFTYVILHSPTLLSLRLRQKLSTYLTWRTAHDYYRPWRFWGCKFKDLHILSLWQQEVGCKVLCSEFTPRKYRYPLYRMLKGPKRQSEYKDNIPILLPSIIEPRP